MLQPAPGLVSTYLDFVEYVGIDHNGRQRLRIKSQKLDVWGALSLAPQIEQCGGCNGASGARLRLDVC